MGILKASGKTAMAETFLLKFQVKAWIITQKCYLRISGHFKKKLDPAGAYLLKGNTIKTRQMVKHTLKIFQQTLQVCLTKDV